MSVSFTVIENILGVSLQVKFCYTATKGPGLLVSLYNFFFHQPGDPEPATNFRKRSIEGSAEQRKFLQLAAFAPYLTLM